MSEWRAAAPTRAELRAALEQQLQELVAGSRLVAREVLAAESHIDLVLAAPDGSAVAVLIAERGGELEALARASAHRSWLAARLRDWRKLSPQLPIEPERPVRALVLARDPCGEARAAARALGFVELRCFQPLTTPDGLRLLLLQEPGAAAAEAAAGSPAARLRTSLSDADLGLSPEEAAAFED